MILHLDDQVVPEPSHATIATDATKKPQEKRHGQNSLFVAVVAIVAWESFNTAAMWTKALL